VALKLVQRTLEVELRGVGQCLNLKHPNLVSLYDVMQAANGDHWVIMEHVAGETLDKVIARHPHGLPPDEALVWLHGICEGVGYLHDQGLVHRDLKPGNLFLENGVVKIGDYGLSKFISASRRSGQTGSVGTVHYMAPEVVNGRYGKEVDLYAIGIIFYEMLTGRVPFDGESPGEILMKHLTAAPDLNALPIPFRWVIGRLLDKDPQRRYSSVQAMLAEIPGQVSAPPVAAVSQYTAGFSPGWACPPPASGQTDSPSDAAPLGMPQPSAASGLWATFLREDPIASRLHGWGQKLSPNRPLHIVLIVLLALSVVLLWPVWLALLIYSAIVLWIRWSKAGTQEYERQIQQLRARAQRLEPAPIPQRGDRVPTAEQRVAAPLPAGPPVAISFQWPLAIALFFGVGIGSLVAITKYESPKYSLPMIEKPWGGGRDHQRVGAGEALVYGLATGFAISGGLLLVLLFLQWVAGRRHTRFPVASSVRDRSGLRMWAVGRVLGRLAIAALVGAGAGLLVGGMMSSDQGMRGGPATLSGLGIGFIAFGFTASMLLLGGSPEQHRPQSVTETPISVPGGGVTQLSQTGSWHPPESG
jgi:hypothetical protein